MQVLANWGMENRVMDLSVLMSVYSKEKPDYLSEALESICNQTYPVDEVVLVVDGPVGEELEQVIQKQKEEMDSLKIVRLPQNVMLGRALAEGLTHCTCEYIARMDSDDIALPNRLEHQMTYMKEHQEIDVLGGTIEEFSDADDTFFKIKAMPHDEADIKKYARYRNPINHMTVMFRKSKVMEAGNYRHFPYLEDYDLWSRMIANGAVFANLPEILVRARIEKSTYQRRGGLGYCKQYLQLRQEQKEMGLLSNGEYLKAIALTMGITLQPNWLRTFVYHRFLRK